MSAAPFTDEEIVPKFKELVNMSASAIEKWLDTDESKEVGQDSGDGESIGRKSARHIIRILHTKKADLSKEDYQHMHKVVAYISRHSAQKPKQVEDSHWLYSLKNWGHDPLKK